jgi:arylsulfatase A-like enzyme
MTSPFSRRDFLKAAGMFPLGMSLAPLLQRAGPTRSAAGNGTNVLVVVFDAFSGLHLPFLGYGRETTPNINSLLERAIVYHNHHAGGNFTTPGTATLLTGVLPWTHRAFQLNGTVTESFEHRTLFNAFAGHHRVAYSHNPLVNTLFKQFKSDIDNFVPQTRLFLTADPLVHSVLGADEDIADVGWTRTMKKGEDGFAYSLFLSELYKTYIHAKVEGIAQYYPRGIPSIRGDNFFLLEDAIDWLESEITRLPEPFAGYIHFMPPHAPCTTHEDFYRAFAGDGFVVPAKPWSPFSGDSTEAELERQRTAYDEYILYLDREFKRLFDYLDNAGMLSNTWVVFTSDHGELFERGTRGHISPMLYQPVVRVPLMIFEPGRTSRLDVHAPTSAIDVLPTLLQVSGEPPADWTEGRILPPFSTEEPNPERELFALHAKANDPEKAITHATAILVRGRYKVMNYFGYPELGVGVERVELYDLQSDPDELHDIYGQQTELGNDLLGVLKAKLREVNAPYV